jgi:para-aminobenzoate synthetase component 1
VTVNKFFSIIPYKDHCIELDEPLSAIAYYKNHTIDLITGKKINSHFSEWILTAEKILMAEFCHEPRVIHLFYELGFLIENELTLLDEETLLAIDCTFGRIKKITIPACKHKIQLTKISSPNFSDYESAFKEGYAELVKGNCYQFNLTYPFAYTFENHYTPKDFIFSLWRNPIARGAFATATYIPYFNKMFLSNSPECLFQYKDSILSSMPIKGTLKRVENVGWRDQWKILSSDKKSQAELYMISDLLRNDLSRIEKPRAQIVKKKFPKLVPGLLHQFSQIDVQLGPQVTLWRVIEKLFPGGSITGAPKVRAMRLINKLEKRKRGFYCGSTILLYKKMKSASINIRSSEITFCEGNNILLYQAGGGITLMSEVLDEFQEMTYKHDSFIHTLTL